MRTTVFIISIMLFAFVSCKKEYQSKLEGNYKGTFNRTVQYVPVNGLRMKN
jgi:hypothetical protein